MLFVFLVVNEPEVGNGVDCMVKVKVNERDVKVRVHKNLFNDYLIKEIYVVIVLVFRGN